MSNSVKQIFPLGFPWDTPDPFLFCVHHLDHYPKANEEMGPDADLSGRNLGNDFTVKDGWRMYHGHTIPGFPSHPHRGFETITIVTRGYCDHSDSLGAAARFGMGDVQWMTAGRGVQHSEMFPLLDQEGPNTMELFQIWLNLPKEKKLVEPHFKILWNDMLPKKDIAGVSITLIAGKLDKMEAPEPPPDSWAADPENDVHIALIDMDAGAAYELEAAREGSNRRLYLFEGSRIRVADTRLAKGQGAVLSNEVVRIQNTGDPCRLLLLQGKPIAEPVAKYGPFVMNTQEEINRAMEEYRLTQFGGWPWPHPDHAHERDKGRFAKYPDGTLVEK